LYFGITEANRDVVPKYNFTGFLPRGENPRTMKKRRADLPTLSIIGKTTPLTRQQLTAKGLALHSGPLVQGNAVGSTL
jgi:hypothetical protein